MSVNFLLSTTYFFYTAYFAFSFFFFLVIFVFLELPLRWERRLRGIGQIFSLDITFVLKFYYSENINLIYHILEMPIKLT